MPHPFIVGERYFDRVGEYTVLRIQAGTLWYRYDNGAEKSARVDVKARIYKNILAEQRSLHPFQSPGYFWALGYLSRYAEFNAEVPPQSQASFEHHYYMLTGLRPVLHSGGYYPIQISTTYDKWGPELRIYFPDKGHVLELPPTVNMLPGNAPGYLRVNNNTFWWQLVRAGFRLGTSHNLRIIRSHLPGKYLPDFDAGHAL
jgi:hypothetical protein